MNTSEEKNNEKIKTDSELFDEANRKLVDAFERKSDTNISDELSFEDIVEQLVAYFKLPVQMIERMDSLEDMLSCYNIISKYIKIDDDVIRNGIFPMLCFRKDDQTPVLLIPNKVWGYKKYDGTGNLKRVSSRELKEYEEGAVTFFTGLPRRRLKIVDLVKYVGKLHNHLEFISYIVFLAGFTGLGMLLPEINRFIFSEVLGDSDVNVFVLIMLALAVVYIFRNIVSSINQIIRQRITTKQSAYIDISTMHRLLSMPTVFFSKYESGEITYRTQYINVMCNTILEVLLDSVLSALMSIIFLFQIQSFSSVLFWPSVIIIAATTAVLFIVSMSRRRYKLKSMEYNSKESASSFNIISGIRKIKMTGSEKRIYAKWSEDYKKAVAHDYSPSFFVLHGNFLVKLISCIGILWFYDIGIKTDIRPEDYVAFTTAYGMVSAAFLGVSDITDKLASISSIKMFIAPFLDTEPELRNSHKILKNVQGGIEFNRVSFSYEGNTEKILDNISFSIEPGECVAVVGPSGSGKSTILRLLYGFEKADSGTIFIDNTDVNDADVVSLRKNIGGVLQSEGLFDMNIADNVSINCPEASRQQIYDALKMAEFEKDLNEMPMKLDTFIVDGMGLSGGQKQRILLARCFLQKSPILVFDEATNALDITTETKVFNTICSLKCTRIIIAHTFSAMKKCDKIIVLDHGKIAEIGKYDDLMSKKGLFYNLAKERENTDVLCIE